MGRVQGAFGIKIMTRNLPLIICMCLAAFGCGKKEPAPAPLPEVLVITVKPQDTPVYKEWIGTLDGFVNAQIRAQVTGYLLTQNYSEGTPVKKGDMLFQIDPRPFEAALSQAQAKLAQDQAQQSRTHWDVERYEPLARRTPSASRNTSMPSNLIWPRSPRLKPTRLLLRRTPSASRN